MGNKSSRVNKVHKNYLDIITVDMIVASIILSLVGRGLENESCRLFYKRIFIIMICISKASMPRKIHTRHLIFCRDSQKMKFMKYVEQWCHCDSNPSSNNQNLNNMSCKQPSPTTHKQPIRSCCPTRCRWICLQYILLLCKKCSKNYPPSPTTTMQLGSLKWVIILKLFSQYIKPNQNPSRDKSTYNCCPWLYHRAPCSYGSKTT
eukprot:Gb_26453 [translate_table: standard]